MLILEGWLEQAHDQVALKLKMYENCDCKIVSMKQQGDTPYNIKKTQGAGIRAAL